MPNFEELMDMSYKFNSFITSMGDITPHWQEELGNNGVVRRNLSHISYNNDYESTERFINSVCSRFGISRSIFTLFSPDEVFERIHMTHPRHKIKMTIEGDKVLAITAPTKPVVEFANAIDILSTVPRTTVDYACGVVHGYHRMESVWEIAGDTFESAFSTMTPIDGFGLPTIYLSFTKDGVNIPVIGKSFKSEIQLGDDQNRVDLPMIRVLKTFNNEEGFVALRERIDSAYRSQASVHECEQAHKILDKWLKIRKDENNDNEEIIKNIRNGFVSMTSSIINKYGIATYESISTKKAKLLPMDCTVMDLIIFMASVANHCMEHLDNKGNGGAHRIFSWIGGMLENEYDLENSLNDYEKSSIMINPNQQICHR